MNDKASAKNHLNIMLEKVNVPELSDSATDWRMFKDLFDENFHRRIQMQQ